MFERAQPTGRSPDIPALRVHIDKASLRPRAYPSLVRLGRDRDGGYVVPADQFEPCAFLVSLGISDDVSFDRDFLARNPTARAVGVDSRVGWGFLASRLLTSSWKMAWNTLIGNREKRLHYWESAWGCVTLPLLYRAPNHHMRKCVGNQSDSDHVRLSEILDRFPPTVEHDVFLKMDIEGAEYDVVPDIMAYAHRIRCIAVEFHALSERTAEFNAAMSALNERFVVVHVHGNNWGGYDSQNDFPETVEITLLNRAVLGGDLPLSSDSYPLPGLDRACDSRRADYDLNFSRVD